MMISTGSSDLSCIHYLNVCLSSTFAFPHLALVSVLCQLQIQTCISRYLLWIFALVFNPFKCFPKEYTNNMLSLERHDKIFHGVNSSFLMYYSSIL